jgi:hypothetical protein
MLTNPDGRRRETRPNPVWLMSIAFPVGCAESFPRGAKPVMKSMR